MINVNDMNYWKNTDLPFWNNEIWIDPDNDDIWINIGYHFPLVTNKPDLQRTVAISGYIYMNKFN